MKHTKSEIVEVDGVVVSDEEKALFKSVTQDIDNAQIHISRTLRTTEAKYEDIISNLRKTLRATPVADRRFFSIRERIDSIDAFTVVEKEYHFTWKDGSVISGSSRSVAQMVRRFVKNKDDSSLMLIKSTSDSAHRYEVRVLNAALKQWILEELAKVDLFL